MKNIIYNLAIFDIDGTLAVPNKIQKKQAKDLDTDYYNDWVLSSLKPYENVLCVVNVLLQRKDTNGS